MEEGGRLSLPQRFSMDSHGIPKRAIFTHVIPRRVIVLYVPAAAGAAKERPFSNPAESDEGSGLLTWNGSRPLLRQIPPHGR